MATVRFGVVTMADDPETARRRNAEAAREALNSVRELGVEERFIRLEGLSLQQAREYDPEQRRWIEKGFEAVREVAVEVYDLEKLPVLVTRIVQEGANRLSGVAYDVRDRDAVRNRALREAVLNAREKARLLASTMDADLGPVQRIEEQNFDFPRPLVRMQQAETAMAARDAAPEPDAYAAGEIRVEARVQVLFALE
jgi:hypothetical protein